MKLYLVRHGEAVSDRVDPSRPLSPTGRTQIEYIARWLSANGASVGQIRHSSKRRAAETAAIIASHVQPDEGTIEAPGLLPNDDFRRMAEDVVHESGSLMLVGHLPFMGLLAGLLLKGNGDEAAVSFHVGRDEAGDFPFVEGGPAALGDP